STGSTLFSQLIDSYIVLYIGFVLPGSLTFAEYMKIAPTNYVLKIVIALALTPVIYLGHYLVKKYLNKKEIKESI
ncbi:MAG: VUT family protein, partial [Flavobacteriia bacterium]|nr:VUT family protein [Flavobacteriia bacterium]